MIYSLDSTVQTLSLQGGFYRIRIRTALRKGIFELHRAGNGEYYAVLAKIPKEIKLWDPVVRKLVTRKMDPNTVPAYQLSQEAAKEWDEYLGNMPL